METFEELPGLIRKVSKKRVESMTLPKREPGCGCVAVGVLPMELRKFYVVWQDAKKVINKTDDELQVEITELRRKNKFTERRWEAIQHRSHISHSRYRDVERNFWSAVCREFPKTFKASALFIGEGWQVVMSKRSSVQISMALREPDCSLGVILRKIITNIVFAD
jgi:hypothetical protein